MDALRAALAAAAAKASEARAANAEAQIAAMKLTIGKLGRALYGQRSERKQRLLDQLELQLDKLEASAPEDELTAEQAAAGATQVKGFPRRRPARKPFPEHLPRERAVAPAPRACECCGSQKLSKIGEDITGTLEVIPRRWKAIRTVREKFTCRACEKIGQPPAPFHPTPRGRAGPNLLAMIPFEKFGQHQPLNRQRERYAREGVDPGLPTPVDRVGPGAVALKPLHDLIASHVPAADRLHGDDTPAPVLARGRTDTARAWIYGRDDRPFGGPDPPAALFRYSRNRSGDRPVEHLRSYAGILQADAFAGYNRSCPRRWCKSLSSVAVSGGWGRAAQSAAAGILTVVLSLTGAMASSVMYPALWTAPSSFCLRRLAPIGRAMASSLGKMATVSVRRLTSPWRRSSGFVACSLARCAAGKVIQAGTSCSASSMIAASFAALAPSRSAPWRHGADALSASSWAKAVVTKAQTTRRPCLPA